MDKNNKNDKNEKFIGYKGSFIKYYKFLKSQILTHYKF